MAGHLNNSLTSAGVFEHLNQLHPGDEVVVTDASGQKNTFVVIGQETYPAEQAPLQKIFATEGPSGLALVTCDGAWVQGKHSYDQRLVVYARLLPQ